MEKYWNHVYYSLYLFENKAAFFFGKILGFIFYPITKIKFLREGLEKRGSSFEEIDKVSSRILTNSKYGQSINMANIHIGGLLAMVEFSIFVFVQAILKTSLIQYVWGDDNPYKWPFIISSLILPYIINNHFLWKNDKYLKYFKKFAKEPKSVRRKWHWISFVTVIGVYLLFAFSLWIWGIAMHL